VKVTRVVDENLSVVLPGLLESELHTANVVLLLDNQTILKAHKCFLSASPVLKEVLMSLEARLDKTPHISMPEFSKESVVSFLHFLYKGFVVLDNSSIRQEFLRLCSSLKVNPPVVKDSGDAHRDRTILATSDDTAGEVPRLTQSNETVLSNQAFSDLSDDEMVIEELNTEDIQQQAGEYEKDTNSNLLLRESSITDKISDVETDNDTDMHASNEITDPAEELNVHKSSSIANPNLQTSQILVPDPLTGSICDNLEPLENNNSPPVYESLANLKSPTEDEYDDETTEHISDFLNLLNTKSLNEKKSQEENEAEPSVEPPEWQPEPMDTFKMPDSFDIPHDYIKEIVPYSSAPSGTTTSFQVSDEEIERKLVEKPVQETTVAVNEQKETKVEKSKTEEKQDGDGKIVRNLNFDEIFKDEFIDNTPVQDEIEQITYKKDVTSRRYRDINKPRDKKAHNPKKDRRKILSSLFSDSEEDLPSTSTSSKKLSFKDSEEPRAVTPSSEESRTPTPTTSLRDELQEKRERMKKKLKRSGGGDVEDPRVVEYRKKKKAMKESTPRKNPSPSKAHICNSSCMCVKNIRHEEDNKWLVPDTYESSDEQLPKLSDSEESSDNTAKPEQSSSQKKKKTVLKKRIILPEDSSEEETDDEEDAEERSKRLDDRKKRKGGDVLAWMSRKARVSVSVQTRPKADILDMALYKMKLLADDGSDESDREVKQPTEKRSDSGSEDSIPRGKRFSPVKLPESEEEVKKPKKKLKKHKKKRKRIRSDSPESSLPVEDVVWTPAMYEKWDKNRKKGGKKMSDSDSDVPRSKLKKFHRSLSNEPKPNIESYKHRSSLSKVQRSMSSLESMGIAHNYGPSSMTKPATSLPKIPKLKKPDSGKL